MARLLINGEPATIALEFFTHFHGHSVFTTLRSADKKPEWWADHWQRVSTHADFFRFRIPSEREVLGLIERELKNHEADQKIRVILTAQHFALTFEPLQLPPSSIYRGVRVALSHVEVHPQLAQFKTGNSLPYKLALQFAESQGAFEGLLVNGDGFVVDGSRTSLMTFDGNCLTALLGGLMGIMRERALAYAQKEGYETKRSYVKAADLKGQLLLANCLIGVVPVGEVQSELVSLLVNKFRPIS